MSDTIITKEFILIAICDEWKRAIAIYEQLGKKPVVTLKQALVTDQKRSMGLADCSTGEIKINNSFIGTKAHEDLIDVIRHEICHFLVGPREGHNKVWKNACKLIGCKPSSKGMVKDIKFIESNFKYTLFAITEDLKTHTVGFRNKKSKRYLDYIPMTDVLSNKGRVVQYYYIDMNTGEVFKSHPTSLLNGKPMGVTKKKKYQLWAKVENGNIPTEYYVGNRARKSRKLLNARPHSYTVRGRLVKEFYYRECA